MFDLGVRIFPIFCVLAACVEESVPVVEPKRDEIVQATVTSTRMPTEKEEAQELAQIAALEEAQVEPADVAVDKSPNACKSRAPWIDVARCTHDGSLYASGSIGGVKDLGLARSTAAERARRALVPGGKGKLEHSEVIDFFHCRGTSYALARMPAGKGDAKACDEKELAARSPVDKGCPEWTRGIAWKDDEGVAGVGAARIKNSSLAQATATNRAKAEIAKLEAIELGTGKSVSTGSGYSELKRDKAVCNGTTYVKVVVRALEAHPH